MRNIQEISTPATSLARLLSTSDSLLSASANATSKYRTNERRPSSITQQQPQPPPPLNRHTPLVQQAAKKLLEEFYRARGCDPTTLPPPLSAIKPQVDGAAASRAAASRPPASGAPPAQPAMTGRGYGGGAAAAPAPVVVEDGAWGGELRQLLKVAGCEHHLEGFRRDQLDGEVLLMMERRDFARMGVTEVGAR